MIDIVKRNKGDIFNEFNQINKSSLDSILLAIVLSLFIEKFVAQITLTAEQYIWGTIHFLYTYIAYGLAIFLYFKW